ncbi:MFS-type transporter SLC18B1-like isoform X2 [Tubulanus polymorphus]|uniref:MFS-type transporter SLC18B1-like isoform X2 n=1 Tax=Tubulanus polymorphus TaxID=672921 RepID=UPI003DA58B25
MTTRLRVNSVPTIHDIDLFLAQHEERERERRDFAVPEENENIIIDDDIPSVTIASRRSRRFSVSEKGSTFGLTRQQKILIINMAFANLCNSVCFSLLAPFFPSEAARKGANGLTVGFIFGIYELVIFITSPIFGSYVGKIGCNFMFCAGAFVCGVCSILFGFLDESPEGVVYIALCFLCRILEAVGGSMFTTASFIITSYCFPGRVATMFGVLETFSGIGMMAGPALGGLLYQVGGFKLPFIIMGTLMCICGLISIFTLPQMPDNNEKRENSVFALLKHMSVILICGIIIIDAIALGFLEPTLEIHLEPFNLPHSLVGLCFLVAPGIYAFTAPVWGFLGDKWKLNIHLMLLGNVAISISYLLLGPSNYLPFLPTEKLWLYLFSLGILGMFVGAALVPTLAELLISAWTLAKFPDNFETYGLTSGLFNSCFSLGSFLGPVGGGYLADELGFPKASSVLAFAMLAWTVMSFIFYVYWGVKSKRHSKNSQLDDVLHTDETDSAFPVLSNTERSPLVKK